MRLETYIKIQKLNPQDMAQLVQCTNEEILAILLGNEPSLELAAKIEYATRGDVSVPELIHTQTSGPIGLEKLRASSTLDEKS